MAWHRWKDPEREGKETQIVTTGGRVVIGRIVSHGVAIDGVAGAVADAPTSGVHGRDVETTVIDERGCFYTGREIADRTGRGIDRREAA